MKDSVDLAQLGWDEDIAGRWASVAGEGDLAGRVIRSSRRHVDVATAEGVLRTETPPELEPVAVSGDWVALAGTRTRRVTAVAPRRSELARRDPSGRANRQVLAANVDEVWVVVGLDRPLNEARLERCLVISWAAGSQPLVVLTKSDLAHDIAAARAAATAVSGGTEVVVTSAVTGEAMADLAARLAAGRTVVLLGPSGAGKSTLLNRLAGEELARTAEVRATDAKGRHTTVTRDLFVLDGGGVIIDTPGLRSLGLADADEGLEAAFAEVAALASDCRFRDCAHDTEPGCAVREAVSGGRLDPSRLQRYRELRQELDEAAEEVTEAERRQRRGGRPDETFDPTQHDRS